MISNGSVKWIENLAEQEGLISAGKLSELDISRTKEEVLALSTTAFTRELKSFFAGCVKLFNSRMKQSSLTLSLGEFPDLIDGFFIQRGHCRLSFISHQPGTIQIQCEKTHSGFLVQSSPVFSGQIQAKFVSFDDVGWFFLEKLVSPEQLCRFYLTEFIQVSRPTEVLN